MTAQKRKNPTSLTYCNYRRKEFVISDHSHPPKKVVDLKNVSK